MDKPYKRKTSKENNSHGCHSEIIKKTFNNKCIKWIVKSILYTKFYWNSTKFPAMK